MGKNRPKIGVKDFKNGRNNSKKLPIIDIYIDIYKTYIIILLYYFEIYFRNVLECFLVIRPAGSGLPKPFLRVQETPPPNPVDFLFLLSLQNIKLY